jgi:formyl-CoA transferase
VEHPSLGTVALPGPPVRYDSGGLGSHRPPPTLGQHTDEVLAWLDSIDPPN